MSKRAARAAVALAAAVVAVAATAVARADSSSQAGTADTPVRLTITSTTGAHAPLPGGVLTGSVTIGNPGPTSRRLTEIGFGPATSDACSRTGLSLAPTLPPTPEAPLEVPAGGSAVLEWTAYTDGESEHACQGATLTSEVLLDGDPAGTVELRAGTLEQPPAPTGGLTTSTRAALRWSASALADPGWVVERAVVGTDAWQPACGSSAARPVRALSCTDTGLTRSTSYRYRVTVRTGHWRATSRPSEPVTTQDRPSA